MGVSEKPKQIRERTEVAGIMMGSAPFANNMRTGNYGWAVLEAFGVAVDAATLAAPGAVLAGVWIQG